MDPLSILRTVWRHRLLAAPVLFLTLAGVCYVLFFGPRVYEASATYVLVNPQVPSADQLDRDARLARLNSNNPYLRASDSSLIVQVMVAKLSADATAEALDNAGLGPDYTVEQSAGNAAMVVVTGAGGTPRQAMATTAWLTERMQQELRTVQKVNGADDLYLFSALPVDVDAEAKEKLSSRLRSLILVGFAGAVLLFGVLSAGTALERARAERPRPAGVQEQEEEEAEELHPTRPTLAASWGAPVTGEEGASHLGAPLVTASAASGAPPMAEHHVDQRSRSARQRLNGETSPAESGGWSW